MLVLQSQSVTSSVTAHGEWNLERCLGSGGVHLVTSIGHNINSIATPRCLWFGRRNDGNVVADLLTGAYHQVVEQVRVERRSNCN